MKILLAFLMGIVAQVSSGHAGVVFEGKIESEILQTNRMVRIYVPPSYERDQNRRYPVLYLHDGQNVFSTAGPQVAFGWGNWELDKTADRYSASGRMQEIIMVAIDCSAARYLDYRGPAHPYSEAELQALSRRPPAPGDNSHYEKYARFLIDELKPRIDREYRTRPEPSNTGVMGASMGGLCSVVLAWQRPDVFGKAASVSGAFQVEQGHFLKNILQTYEGKPKPVRIYLDSGIASLGGNDDGKEFTKKAARELGRIGWRDERDLKHFVDEELLNETELQEIGLRRDNQAEAQISQHNEFYWRLRAWRPLVFLFPAESL